MKKHELIGLTLNQLISTFYSNPESFELDVNDLKPYFGSSNDTIMWRPRVPTDQTGTYAPDPNNPSRSVIIFFNKNTKEIQCCIYMTSLTKASDGIHLRPDAKIDCFINKYFYLISPNYRKFQLLKKLIQKRDRDAENDKFLRKLHNVFPGTFDDFIFGK